MATQHPNLKRKGRFWHYSLKINGVRAHGSTRAPDLATAKRVLEAKRRELLEGDTLERSSLIPFSRLAEEWAEAHKRTLSRKHLVRTEQISRLWLLPRVGALPYHKVTTADALAIRTRVLDQGRSATTANNVLRTLKLLLNFGRKVYGSRQIRCRIDLLRVQRKPRPVLPAERVAEFLMAVDRATTCPQKHCMVRVMLGMGMREGEVLGMRWEWLDPARRTYVVGKAKGMEARVIPVPEWVWSSVAAMPKTTSPWCFVDEAMKPRRPNFLRGLLSKVSRDLGLGRLTQHRLRATFASLHAEAGTPVPEIQGMLGHKQIATTMLYIEHTLASKRRSQDALAKQLGLA